MAAETSRSGASADSYIGSLISLTSKCEIRYEGVFYNINTEESSIGLRNVRSFGTEGRKKDGQQIPPSDKIYEYILFRGSDIKDLQVKSSPPVQTAPPIHNDPAIIQSHYPRPAFIPTTSPPVGSGMVADLSSHTVQGGAPRPTFQLPLYQPGGSLGSWNSSQHPPTVNGSGLTMPMYWQGFYAPSGGLPHLQQPPLLRPPGPPPSLSIPQSMQQPLHYPGMNPPFSSGFQNLPGANAPLPSGSTSLPGANAFFPSVSSNMPGISASLPSGPSNLPGTVASLASGPSNFPGISLSLPSGPSSLPGVGASLLSGPSSLPSGPSGPSNFPAISASLPSGPSSLPGIGASLLSAPSNMPGISASLPSGPLNLSRTNVPSSAGSPSLPGLNPSLPSGSLCLPKFPPPLLPPASSNLILASTALPASTQSAGIAPEMPTNLLPNKPAVTSLPATTLTTNLALVSPLISSNESVVAPISSKPRTLSVSESACQTVTQPVPSFNGPSSASEVEKPGPCLLTPGQLLHSGPSAVLSSSSPSTSQPLQVGYKAADVKPTSSEPPRQTPTDAKEPILPLPTPSYKKQNGAALYTHHNNRGRGRGRGNGYAHAVTKFTEDFDFTAMNEKFNKDEVWGHLGKSKTQLRDKEDVNEEDDIDILEEDVVEASKFEIKPIYVKDDFFDSLSCNALDRGTQNGRAKFSEQMKIDTETFGDFPRYRGRGGGRDFRGGGRTRGSYYGRGYRYNGRGRGHTFSNRTS